MHVLIYILAKFNCIQLYTHRIAKDTDAKCYTDVAVQKKKLPIVFIIQLLI